MASKKRQLTIGRIIFTLIYILIFPTALLFLSGDWLWIKGWIFNIWFIILCFGTIIYLYIKDPALLLERYKKPGTGGQKGWDIIAVYGIVVGFISWIVIMPLDAKKVFMEPVLSYMVKWFRISFFNIIFLLFVLCAL